MGTSSIYGGPKRSPLIPSDFDDNNPNGQNDSNQEDLNNANPNQPNSNKEDSNNPNEDSNQSSSNTNSWQASKNAMSKYISSGKSSGIKSPLSKYVKAHGGAQNATRSAATGVKAATKLGTFLLSVSSQGIESTLNQYQIDYKVKSPEEVLDSIFNELAPTPNSKDDSIARNALIKTVSKLYDLLDADEHNIEVLNQIDDDFCKKSVSLYIENYIIERIMNDLGMRFEKTNESINRIINVEREMKDYIHSVVSVEFESKNISFNSVINDVNPTIDSIYQDCYKVMEDQI